MNDQQLDDLKQFIDSKISQSEANLGSKLNDVNREVKELRSEMHDGFVGVGDAVEQINQRLDDKDKEDNKRNGRITRLEQQIA